MVKLMTKTAGSALAMTLLVLGMMVTLLLVLNRLVVNYQRAAANVGDYELAQNVARMALLSAESTVYNFDMNAGMESLTATARLSQLALISNNSCNNQGWCFSRDKTWQPWLQTSTATNPVCSSYAVSKSGSATVLPWLDQATGNFVAYASNLVLCGQPRYIMELVTPSFSGQQVRNQAYGQLTQLNGASLRLYDAILGAAPARLYRITVRAFGRNGNTRVMLQEYVVIVGNSQLRTSDEVINQQNHHIIPISIRWLHDDL